MPITIYPGSMKKRNANGSYSDLVPAIATDPEVLDDFAEEYSTSETYNIGDYCIHNSDLYKCNTNNTIGTWNNNAWDRVSVADELVDHKNTLNQLDQNMAYVESGNTASRNYSKGQFISWKGTLYTVSADNGISSGQSFSIGTGGNLAAVVDNNGALCGGLNDIKNAMPYTTGLISISLNSNGYGQTPYLVSDYAVVQAFNSGTINFPYDGGDSYWWVKCLRPGDLSPVTSQSRDFRFILIKK